MDTTTLLIILFSANGALFLIVFGVCCVALCLMMGFCGIYCVMRCRGRRRDSVEIGTRKHEVKKHQERGILDVTKMRIETDGGASPATPVRSSLPPSPSKTPLQPTQQISAPPSPNSPESPSSESKDLNDIQLTEEDSTIVSPQRQSIPKPTTDPSCPETPNVELVQAGDRLLLVRSNSSPISLTPKTQPPPSWSIPLATRTPLSPISTKRPPIIRQNSNTSIWRDQQQFSDGKTTPETPAMEHATLEESEFVQNEAQLLRDLRELHRAQNHAIFEWNKRLVELDSEISKQHAQIEDLQTSVDACKESMDSLNRVSSVTQRTLDSTHLMNVQLEEKLMTLKTLEQQVDQKTVQLVRLHHVRDEVEPITVLKEHITVHQEEYEQSQQINRKLRHRKVLLEEQMDDLKTKLRNIHQHSDDERRKLDQVNREFENREDENAELRSVASVLRSQSILTFRDIVHKLQNMVYEMKRVQEQQNLNATLQTAEENMIHHHLHKNAMGSSRIQPVERIEEPPATLLSHVSQQRIPDFESEPFLPLHSSSEDDEVLPVVRHAPLRPPRHISPPSRPSYTPSRITKSGIHVEYDMQPDGASGWDDASLDLMDDDDQRSERSEALSSVFPGSPDNVSASTIVSPSSARRGYPKNV